MRRNGLSTLGFPPFTRAVKALIIINAAIWFLQFFVGLISHRLSLDLYLFLREYMYLIPDAVVFHGFIWQLVTYGFLHDGFMHLLFNMLGLWMFGSQFEMDFGTRRFYEFYFWCLVGAALTTLGVGAIGLLGFAHLSVPLFAVMGKIWAIPTIGASGAVYGLLIAFGILYGDRQIYVFPFPIAIKARYIVGIWLLISFVNAFSGGNGVAEFAHLGGALFGWMYLKFIPRYGLQTAASEGMFGLRNRYYRWKRRQAAKKFEVYMRKTDRQEFFDEHGNYLGPKPKDKDDDSGWVN